MSWTMSAIGTREGVKKTLSEQKIYGTPSAEEQAQFDYARDTLNKVVESNPEPSGEVYKCVFDVSASGHGTQISNLSVKYQVVRVA